MINCKIKFCINSAFLLLLTTCCLLHTTLYAQPLEPEMTPIGVKFSYENPKAKSVTLAGEFNNWDMKKNPLKIDEKGVWSAILPLKEGRYEYKFIIDGNWMKGANLVVRVKKDKQTGKLYIPEPKPGILTAYSNKIKFSGKYVGLLPANFESTENIPVKEISTPINHLNFDWYITPTEET
ncbi:MAG: glycogen-binding domain-containing protein, partial [Elusimicrobiota bacterium]|nr:glycogen-binding domain-containing protein [Elusimicrobiota bacterium]